MTTRTISTHAAFSPLPSGEADLVPNWIQLTPGGVFSGRDGRGPFEVKDPAAVIAASMADPNIIDQCHAADLAAQMGLPAPAVGRVAEMVWRGDAPNQGLWARVDWNTAGRQLLSERAYAGISPVLEHDAGGVISAVPRATLTNTPNLKIQTLNAQEAAVADEKKPEAAAAVDQSEIDKLNQRIAQLEGEKLAAEAAAAVDAAIAEGKAAPVERAALLSAHSKMGAAGFKELMAVRPKLIGVGVSLHAAKAASSDGDATAIADKITSLMVQAARDGKALGFAEAAEQVRQGGAK